MQETLVASKRGAPVAQPASAQALSWETSAPNQEEAITALQAASTAPQPHVVPDVAPNPPEPPGAPPSEPKGAPEDEETFLGGLTSRLRLSTVGNMVSGFMQSTTAPKAVHELAMLQSQTSVGAAGGGVGLEQYEVAEKALAVAVKQINTYIEREIQAENERQALEDDLLEDRPDA
jgi:hypothetical protein